MFEKSFEFYQNCNIAELTNHLSKLGFKFSPKKESFLKKVNKSLGTNFYYPFDFSQSGKADIIYSISFINKSTINQMALFEDLVINQKTLVNNQRISHDYCEAF